MFFLSDIFLISSQKKNQEQLLETINMESSRNKEHGNLETACPALVYLFPVQLWLTLNLCHAEYIKIPHPFLIFSQSDYLIKIVDINSHT